MSTKAARAGSFGSNVPTRLPEGARLDPAARRSGRHIDAATFFADVSGFTRLTESLASAGIVGTERLGSRLNATFGSMIELIVDSGGEIGAFPGAAGIASWPADERA